MVKKLCLLLIACAGLLTLLPGLAYALDGGTLGSADAQFLGEGSSHRAGHSVALAGDVNGDGYDDILIGAKGDGGGAYLALGGAGGWGLGTSLGGSGIIQYSGSAGEEAGTSVAGVGDVNGDGYDDLLIGAPDYNSHNGRAYLVLGQAVPVNTNLNTGADAYFEAGSVDDWNGYSVAGAGDVNGDGYDDLLIGAYGYPNGDNQGRACLVLGSSAIAGNLPADACYQGEASGDRAGGSVAGAGDVNGDGYADLLIGAYSNNDGPGVDAGAAYLVLGSAVPAGGNLSSAIQYTGEADNDWAGGSVAGAGDVNGDGYADLLIGAAYNDDNGSDAGAAYLVLGSATPASVDLSTVIQYTGEAAGDAASIGMGVAGAGDVDGDGYADLLIGAASDDGGSNAGAAYLVLGSAAPISNTLSSAIQYTGEAADDFAGWSVAGAGDVNGDGYADLLIGAPNNHDGPGSYAGAAYLIFSDYLTHGSAPFRQRQRLLGNGGGALPVTFDQAGVRVDLSAGAVAGGEINVQRHSFHPCNTSKRLQMPIWSIDSNKFDPISGSSLTIRFEYTDGQIDGMTESNLGVWKRSDGQSCGSWTQISSGITRDAATNQITVTLTSVTDLSQFTLADSTPSPTAVNMMPMSVRLAKEPIWLVALMALLVITAGATYTYLSRQGLQVTQSEAALMERIAASVANRMRQDETERK